MAKKAMTSLHPLMLDAEEPALPNTVAAIEQPQPAATTSAKPGKVALTLKVDQDVYRRLATLGIERMKSKQDLLTEALLSYLSQQENR